MKKNYFFLLLPLLFLTAGCSLIKDKNPEALNFPKDNEALNVCQVPDLSSSTPMETKTGLPPVSQEEKNKTFTYEDTELGVKMQYPGSCYFNKGMFQCSDFILSVWEEELAAKANNVAEKTYTEGQTQLKYTYNYKGKTYTLMAWYDGEDKVDLDKVIDTMAKSLTFTR